VQRNGMERSQVSGLVGIVSLLAKELSKCEFAPTRTG